MNTDTVFKTLCPKCAQEFAAPLALAGQPIVCPHCQRQVELPADPPRAAIIEPQHATILIQANGPTIQVAPPGVVLALNVIAALQLIGGLGGWLFGLGLPLAVGIAVSAVVMFALARLITSAHESATRLARLEIFFQEAANQRK